MRPAVRALGGVAMVLGAASVGSIGAGSPVAAQSVTVPIAVAFFTDGTFLPVVEVSIAGSDPLRMLLDTGSQGLVVNPDRLRSTTEPVIDTGIATTVDYDGGDVSGEVKLGAVTVGGQTTTAPVVFIEGTSCTPSCLGAELDLDGILGISQGINRYSDSAGTTYEWFSVLAQLGGGLGVGHTLSLTSTGGTLELGRPRLTAPGTVVLQAVALDQRYSTGRTIYQKEFTTCWTIVAQTSCLPTVLDSGERGAVLMGAQFAPWTTPVANPTSFPGVDTTLVATVNAGTVISFAPPGGAATFWSRTVASASRSVGLYETTGSPYLNSGNILYQSRSVGFDNDTGRVSIGPIAGLPGPVTNVTASFAAGAIDVSWQQPQDPGSGAIESFVIRVTQAGTGNVVTVLTVTAPASSTSVTGLVAATYTVEVAAANAAGLGPWTAAPGAVQVAPPPTPNTPIPATPASPAPRPQLPATGSARLLWLSAVGAAFLAAGAVLVVWTRSRPVATIRPRHCD